MDHKYSMSYLGANGLWTVTRTLTLRETFAWTVELLDGGDIEELHIIDVQSNEIVYSNPDWTVRYNNG